MTEAAPSPATVGWCPGALRPMESGDGLILRLKPRGGRLTLDQAEAVARLSLRDGNGQLDLTSRANLQVRGVTTSRFDALLADLRALGLVDRSGAVEAVRNIVVSPLAGCDPGRPDVRPVLRALERRLAEDAGLQSLPAKWSFVVDDGGPLPLSGVAADVRLVMRAAGVVALQFDGLDGEALVAVDHVPDTVSRIGRLAGLRRMRDLAGDLGPAVFVRLALAAQPRAADGRPGVIPADLLGTHHTHLGFAPAFGGLAAADLLAAVEVLRAAAGREVRLTPWRTLLVPAEGGVDGRIDALEALGFVVDPDDPRLGLSACVGAPACHRATTGTRAHAAVLAEWRQTGIHVAGCAKGCGQTAAAAWTLVGRDGRYDVVANGTARDGPVARGLSFPDAAAWISRAGQARTI